MIEELESVKERIDGIIAKIGSDEPVEPTPSDPETPGTPDQQVYELDLKEWNVYNDGTHPEETTKGINRALVWAKEQGYDTLKLPAGTFLISKGDGTYQNRADSLITLISDMTLLLDDDTVLQKETNGYDQYSLIHVSPLVDNVTIKGGTLIGDRDTHDYTTIRNTHEWGHGINIVGGRNITVDGVNIQKFSGDGVYIGGSTMPGSYPITASGLEVGGIDSNGKPINESGKIRTKELRDFSNITHERHKIVNIWLAEGLNSKNFEVFYYDANGNFLSKDIGRVYTKYSIAPKEADTYKIVFNAANTSKVKMTMMSIENAKDVRIVNNDIGHNRRQGITAGGEDIQILNNNIHDTTGVAPQSGIDIEPGFFPARNQLIKGNTFKDNKIQMVLAYGNDAVIEENTFISDREKVPGTIGLHVHADYVGVKISNNTFEQVGLTSYPANAEINGNHFVRGGATLYGANNIFKNNTITDGGLSVGSGNSEGTIISDTTIISTGDHPKNGGSLTISGKPVIVENVQLKGTPETPVTIAGYSAKDTVFNGLVMENGASGTTGLPSGTYVNSAFNYTGNGTSALAVQYNADVTIKDSEFNDVRLGLYSITAKAQVEDSVFNYTGDLENPAIYVTTGDHLTVENSVFNAKNLTKESVYIVKIGQHAWKNRPAKINSATVKGNQIYTNLAARGIYTPDAGIGAPAFDIQNNTLYGAKLYLTDKDINVNNKEMPYE
ncbi:hypothetical protein BEP19_02210 [Ammoniphilus oxalaticus]|uniref:Right handed beta helix domain-containing protein n=1 Tax=Ammoniphilus oxalaticus TaxID=66863 RepID=A0A419SP11_9BACL|nr:hypothetical protein BEP19_02210 [Ammoniphilus oxalaticus]